MRRGKYEYLIVSIVTAIIYSKAIFLIAYYDYIIDSSILVNKVPLFLLLTLPVSLMLPIYIKIPLKVLSLLVLTFSTLLVLILWKQKITKLVFTFKKNEEVKVQHLKKNSIGPCTIIVFKEALDVDYEHSTSDNKDSISVSTVFELYNKVIESAKDLSTLEVKYIKCKMPKNYNSLEVEKLASEFMSKNITFYVTNGIVEIIVPSIEKITNTKKYQDYISIFCT